MQESDSAILDANIAAMAAFCPRAAEGLRGAKPPASVRPTPGRDGAPTYAWVDDQGRHRWLGRTSMPTVSSVELVGMFQPGPHNVLLSGFGQGAEVQLLLRRLAPHQAVFAVDENPWAVTLSLGLYDFADDLRAGRLLCFVGSAAWAMLRDFLLEHDGFLTPQRILSWPWFDAAEASEVSDRVSAIASEVASRRETGHAETRKRRNVETSKRRTVAQRQRPSDSTVDPPVIAVLSNLPDARVHRFGRHLSAAAESLGWPCSRFLLERPAMVHPYAIEAALWKASPTVVVLVDVSGGALHAETPPVPSLIVWTQTQPLPPEWVKHLAPSVRLGVRLQRQQRQAVELGVDPARVLLLPPAAVPGQETSKRRNVETSKRRDVETSKRRNTAFSRNPAGVRAKTSNARVLGPVTVTRCTRIIVIADGHDLSPNAVGLHLASHRRLWKAAGQILQHQCDTYHDDHADAVLDAAQRKLRIKIDSSDVRQGLTTRIRQVLGPVLARRAYCLALVQAGIDFDLHGGWDHDDTLKQYDRGPWPDPADVPAVLEGHALIVSIEPSGTLQPPLLDGIAAGLVAAVRAHPLDDTHDGLSAVLNPARHVWRFDTRRDLVQLLQRFQTSPADFLQRATDAAAHVNAHHTWASRLKIIVHACQTAPNPQGAGGRDQGSGVRG
jgi:hypothetical protein